MRILSILARTAFAEGVCGELRVRGHDVIVSLAWAEAQALAADAPIAAVLFDSSDAGDFDTSREAALTAVREASPDVIAIGLGAARAGSDQAEPASPAAGRQGGVLRIAAGAMTPTSVAGRIDGAIGRAARLRALREQLSALHQRLLAGDREAAGEVWTIAARELRRRLRRRTKAYQWSRLEDAVTDACVKLGRRPDRVDPNRGDLLTWLTTVARNRLFDLLRDSERRRRHEVPLLVEAARGLPDVRGEDARVRGEWVADHLRDLLAVATDETERRFLEAHVRAAPLAEVADIIQAAHLSVAEQEALEKLWWHRLYKRFRRQRRTRGAGK